MLSELWLPAFPGTDFLPPVKLSSRGSVVSALGWEGRQAHALIGTLCVYWEAAVPWLRRGAERPRA